MRLRWPWQLLSFVALLVPIDTARAAGGPSPDAYLYRALIDSDSDDNSGCDVAAHDDNFAGPVKGIEFIVEAIVLRFPTNADVEKVRLRKCISGTDFELADLVDSGDWPVSLENGVGGADVVEFYVPRAKIGNPASITLGFHATRPDADNDVLLTKNGRTSGDDIVFDVFGALDVPVLSRLALFLAIGLFATLAWWSLRRGRPQTIAAAVTAFVVTLAASGWAVTIMLDGQLADWTGVPQIAADVLDDSTADDPAEDIVVAFVTADAQNIYFRMDQVNLCPVQCGNGVLESGETCESGSHCVMDFASGEGSGAIGMICECIDCMCSKGCWPP